MFAPEAPFESLVNIIHTLLYYRRPAWWKDFLLVACHCIVNILYQYCHNIVLAIKLACFTDGNALKMNKVELVLTTFAAVFAVTQLVRRQ